MPAASDPGSTRSWLVAWAVSYNAAHHLGLLPGGLGQAGGGTRWADWLDLLVPWVVVGTALLALRGAGTDRRGWTTALAGAGLYVQGHALHLAANSIGNARGDAAPVHLWDEILGHLIWYGGFAVLVAVLSRAAAPTALRPSPTARVLALLTGATWTTNTLGADGLLPAGLAAAALLTGQGWALRRTGAGTLLLTAFVPSTVLLVVAAVSGPAT